DASALLRDMRRELLALEPNLVFVENQTMEAEVGATLFPVRAGALLVTVVGLAVGCLLAAIVGAATGSVLYGIRASDPVSWLGASALLLGVSAIANVIPALKASRVEPSQALRME